MKTDDGREISRFGVLVTNVFTAFDRHCIMYFAMVGAFLSCFCIVDPQDPIKSRIDNLFSCVTCTVVVCGIVWYILKAIFVTARTAANWKHTNPGEPTIKAGGLTEYDRGFAEQIGKSMAEAQRRQGHDNGGGR